MTAKRKPPLGTEGAAGDLPVLAVLPEGVTGALVECSPTPHRRPLPDERQSLTHKFRLGPWKFYVTVGEYGHEPDCGPSACASTCWDKRPGELAIRVAAPDRKVDPTEEVWSMLRGNCDVIAESTSRLLQYGVPLGEVVEPYVGMRFSPWGATGNRAIPKAASVVDYVSRWLLRRYDREGYDARFGVREGGA